MSVTNTPFESLPQDVKDFIEGAVERYDVRTVQRRIDRGDVKPADYAAYQAGLDDCSDNLVESKVVFQHSRRPRR
jgi:hypothetical protein